VTEAFGWRGIASLNKGHRVIAEKPLAALFPELFDAFSWAVEESLELISGNHHQQSLRMAETLKAMVCDAAEDRDTTLSRYYQRLLPQMYDAAAGEPLGVESTATTSLLSFSPDTASLPRFRLLGLFLNPLTRQACEEAYNQAVAGTEMYVLSRFGAGALPFDVVIPGKGRGTLRLGTRGGVIMTPLPLGFSFRKAPETPGELAAILEKRFGPGVVVIGKAVTLLGMLAAEHIFVFHEGASSYIPRSRRMHELIRGSGIDLPLHPMLRVRHRPWEALEECCAWLKLPEPLRRPFGTDELSAPSFAVRWKEVAQAQEGVLAELSQLRRPLALVQHLQEAIGGHWRCLAAEYESLHQRFSDLEKSLDVLRRRKKEVLARIKDLKARVDANEKARGRHWKERVFEMEPSAEDLARREQYIADTHRLHEEVHIAWDQWRGLQAEQDELVGSPEVKRAQLRRADIALEAELMRTRLVRGAVVAGEGLQRAGFRPSAWWFPLVCPDGAWFRANARRASFRVERL
jgi:hypothetical protein